MKLKVRACTYTHIPMLNASQNQQTRQRFKSLLYRLYLYLQMDVKLNGKQWQRKKYIPEGLCHDKNPNKDEKKKRRLTYDVDILPK